MKGLSIDWRRLYGEAKPRRISLPTYPFAKERYWVEAVTGPAAGKARGSNGAIPHPPLHRNVSDASSQRFSTRLSGEEPYLREVNGGRVLPEVAHLELARAAVTSAAGDTGAPEVRLEQVEWFEPVVVGAEGLRAACRAVCGRRRTDGLGDLQRRRGPGACDPQPGACACGLG